jgi:hypothetical protein
LDGNLKRHTKILARREDSEQLSQIRKWIAEGVKLVDIARRMNCNERAIGKIKRGERYARC